MIGLIIRGISPMAKEGRAGAHSGFSIVVPVLETVLVAVAIGIAHLLQATVSFIPRQVISLPQVDYGMGDLKTVLLYFLCIHGAVFLANTALVGKWQPASAKRSGWELYVLALAYTLSTLAVFVTSSVAFDPNFIVGIALVAALLFILAGAVTALLSATGLFAYLGALLLNVLRRVFSVSGLLILAFALTPGVLAKLFVSDRDVANVITQIRIYFSGGSGGDYHFSNALGGEVFDQPMQVRLSPLDSSRLFVLEREGSLLSLDYPAGGERQVELDIRGGVGNAEVENGALGFAFSPAFADDRQVYIYYTSVSANGQTNRLSRFTLGQGADSAASEQVLISLPRETSGFHNGGSVEFGPDGYLYVALGEGVRPRGIKSQQKTLRAGILRIDVFCSDPARSTPVQAQPAKGFTAHYCIPVDNPFVASGEVLPEYWALGLRNPYRIAFDSANGDLWVGDVGSTKWEEINLVEAGGNYQYPWVEGQEAGAKSRPAKVVGRETGPVYSYVHTAYDRAVIGGVMYHGERFPELAGLYLFADNYSSKLFTLDRASGEPVVEHIATANQYAQRGTSSLTALANGDILATTLGRSAVATGEVLRLVRGDETEVPTPAQPATAAPAYSLAELESIFVTNCSRCHGSRGAGDGPDTPALGVPVPDLTSAAFQQSRSDEQLLKVIREGGYAVGMSPLMPAWQHLLAEDEINGMLRLLRHYATGDGD